MEREIASRPTLLTFPLLPPAVILPGRGPPQPCYTAPMSETSQSPNGERNSVPAGEPLPVTKGSHVYLVDGSGYIFRAFHALSERHAGIW